LPFLLNRLRLLSQETPSILSLPESEPELESELLYNWRFTANHFVLAPIRLRPTTSIFISTEHLLCYTPYVIYNCCWSSPAQSFSRPSIARPYCTVSDSRSAKPGVSGLCICIHQEESDPFTPPSTGFPLLRLLRLAGLRWRYSNSPSHGSRSLSALDPRCIASVRPHQKTSLPNNSTIVTEACLPSLLRRNGSSSIVACVFISAGTCLPSRCLAMIVYSGSAIPAFRRHVTMT
jgi:hypothetical protein